MSNTNRTETRELLVIFFILIIASIIWSAVVLTSPIEIEFNGKGYLDTATNDSYVYGTINIEGKVKVPLATLLLIR